MGDSQFTTCHPQKVGRSKMWVVVVVVVVFAVVGAAVQLALGAGKRRNALVDLPR